MSEEKIDTGISEFIKEKALNPFICYFIVSWFLFNWHPLAYFFLAETDIAERIRYVENFPRNNLEPLIIPLLYALALSILVPIISIPPLYFRDWGTNQYRKLTNKLLEVRYYTSKELKDFRNKIEVETTRKYEEANNNKITTLNKQLQIAKENNLFSEYIISSLLNDHIPVSLDESLKSHNLRDKLEKMIHHQDEILKVAYIDKIEDQINQQRFNIIDFFKGRIDLPKMSPAFEHLKELRTAVLDFYNALETYCDDPRSESLTALNSIIEACFPIIDREQHIDRCIYRFQNQTKLMPNNNDTNIVLLDLIDEVMSSTTDNSNINLFPNRNNMTSISALNDIFHYLKGASVAKEGFCILLESIKNPKFTNEEYQLFKEIMESCTNNHDRMIFCETLNTSIIHIDGSGYFIDTNEFEKKIRKLLEDESQQ